MKKILFATTALVATAGVAAADDNLSIALSGSGEIGIVGGDAYGDTTQFHTDVDVTFSMTGEADNGLAFGIKIDLDELANGIPATTQVGETAFLAYGNMRLEMGDTDGAFDAALTEVAIGGTIDDTETSHAGYNGNSGMDGTHDGQIARFQYSASSFTGHLSVEIDDTGADDAVWGVGVAYSADLGGTTLGVGLGYQSGEETGVDESVWGVSVSAAMANGFEVRLNYSEYDFDTGDNQSHMAIGLGYSMNALTVGLNYGEYNDFAGTSGDDRSGWALVVDYDLGGGLEAQFGYGSSDNNGVDSDQFSLGLAMSF